MNPQTHHQTVRSVIGVEIGQQESAVVQVEAGEASGYLIAEACGAGAHPLEFSLVNVVYMVTAGAVTHTAKMSRVLISTRDGWRAAVEPDGVSLIPCPSASPYPIIFISKHGFQWMTEMILRAASGPVISHLGSRFASSGFLTDRSVMNDSALPFSRIPRIATAPAGW